MNAETNNAQPPFPRAAARRKRVLIIGLSALSLVAALILAAAFYISSGRLNRYLASEVEKAIRDYGVRAEIGSLDLGWLPRTISLHNVKLYNRQTGQLIAVINRLALSIEMREPFALRLRREIALKQLDLDGVSLFVEIDEDGSSNFQGLRQPPPSAPRRITFDYSSLVGKLTGAQLFLNDRRRDIEAALADLRAIARPIPGAETVDVQFASGESRVIYQGREDAKRG